MVPISYIYIIIIIIIINAFLVYRRIRHIEASTTLTACLPGLSLEYIHYSTLQ
jgi:hypothetical protein